MEPSLVIINACIPTMQHLVKILFPSAVWNNSKPQYAYKENQQSFQRMQDEYSLALVTDKRDVQNTIRVTNAETGDDSSGSMGADDESQRRVIRPTVDFRTAININKEWTVDSGL